MQVGGTVTSLIEKPLATVSKRARASERGEDLGNHHERLEGASAREQGWFLDPCLQEPLEYGNAWPVPMSDVQWNNPSATAPSFLKGALVY